MDRVLRTALTAALIAAILLALPPGAAATTYDDQPSEYSSSLVTHNGSYVYDWQLANMVDMWIADEGFANMLFIGTQCYSGGMMDEMGDRLRGDGDVAMTSSARHDETAKTAPDDPTSPSNRDFWQDEAGFDQAESAWAKEIGEGMARTGDDAPTAEEMAENAADQDPAKDDGLFEDKFGEKFTEHPQFRELGNGGDVKLGKKTDGSDAASKHAILFSGQTEGRHWNNVERAHDALKGHGFTEGNIDVLAGGGTGDPDAPGYVDGPGTKKALFDAIENLRDEMDENEQFVLWTDDHGNRERTETALDKAVNDTVKQTMPPLETASTPDEEKWGLDESFLDDIRAEPDNTPYVSLIVEPTDFEAFPDTAEDYRIILNDEPLSLDTVDRIEALDADPDLDGYELVYPVENENLLKEQNTIEGEWIGDEDAFRPFTIDTLLISTGKIDEVVPPEAVPSDDLFRELNGSVENYNSNVDSVPGLVRSLVSEERINAEVGLESGETLEIGIETRDARVTRFQRGHFDDPSMTASTDESTAREIATSGDPAGTAVEAVRSGEIDYGGVGAANSIKTGATRIAIRVYTTIRGVIG